MLIERLAAVAGLREFVMGTGAVDWDAEDAVDAMDAMDALREVSGHGVEVWLWRGRGL